MNTFKRASFKTEWLPVKSLSVVWASAQREFNPAWAQSIADNFDPDIFDELIVTLPNGNGIYHVVDGQHRVGAVRTLYGDDEQVPCRIVDANSPARAAEIFDRCNTGRRRPQPLEMFKVRVTAGGEAEVAINRIVKAAGYKIGGASEDGHIGSVEALKSVYRYSADTLKDTLTIIQATWGLDKNAVVGPLIRGFGTFMAEYGHKANWQRISDGVSKHFTPGRLLGAAKNAKEVEHCSLTDAVKLVIRNTYNRGLKSGRLD